MAMTLYFDGCSKGNPGKAGAGAVLYDESMNETWATCCLVGNHSTNNEAEYTGLIIGLRRAVELGLEQLFVKGDSQLIIRQMKKEYKVKSGGLIPLYQEALRLSSQIKRIQFEHVYRHNNRRADELSNLGLNA